MTIQKRAAFAKMHDIIVKSLLFWDGNDHILVSIPVINGTKMLYVRIPNIKMVPKALIK